MSAPAAPPPVAVDPPSQAAGLRAQVAQRQAEQQRLRLRIQDLEQPWQRRLRPVPAPPPVGQLTLLGDDLPANAAVDPSPLDPTAPRAARPARPRAHPPGRQPLDPELPREVIALPDPPEAARICADTGVPLVRGFEQVLEALARRPAVYFVKRCTRAVWVSPAKSAPLMTPWPADVLPRARMHASVVAHIAAAHFSEHVPYHRLEQQLARTGVALARSTQVSLMARLDALVAPLVAHLQAQVLASGYVHLEATPADVCDPARPGAARPATLCASRARSPDPLIDGLVWFDYQATKSPQHPRALVQAAGYRGVIQTDGASGLEALGPPDVITHLGCRAHARRYVAEAARLGDPRARASACPSWMTSSRARRRASCHCHPRAPSRSR